MSDFDLDGWLRGHGLSDAFRATVTRAIAPLAARIRAELAQRGTTLIVGLCGSQGSGKSTFADLLARLLEADGPGVAVLSLDDLYLTHAERAAPPG
jgi:D-glycerate 3-kinase